MPVSMHYRLCLVTVCMKVLKNGRLIRFSKWSDCWYTFSWSICNENSHFIRCIRAAVSKVTTTYTNHGRTSSAKRNSGRKPKLSEMDCCTLKRIVSVNHRCTVAKVTAEINIHLEAVSTKTVWQKFHKNNIHGRATIVEPLITENSAERWRRWCNDQKLAYLMM